MNVCKWNGCINSIGVFETYLNVFKTLGNVNKKPAMDLQTHIHIHFFPFETFTLPANGMWNVCVYTHINVYICICVNLYVGIRICMCTHTLLYLQSSLPPHCTIITKQTFLLQIVVEGSFVNGPFVNSSHRNLSDMSRVMQLHAGTLKST